MGLYDKMNRHWLAEQSSNRCGKTKKSSYVNIWNDSRWNRGGKLMGDSLNHIGSANASGWNVAIDKLKTDAFSITRTRKMCAIVMFAVWLTMLTHTSTGTSKQKEKANKRESVSYKSREMLVAIRIHSVNQQRNFKAKIRKLRDHTEMFGLWHRFSCLGVRYVHTFVHYSCQFCSAAI